MPGAAEAEIYFIAAMMVLILIISFAAVYFFFKQYKKEMKERDLVVDIAPDLPLMRLDYSLMERVLVNLLHNAVMYTPPAARIRLTARREDKELAQATL